MSEEILVQLYVTGFQCDPSEITTLIGLTPSQTWRTGEFIATSRRKYQNNGWRLAAPRKVHEVEAGVDALFEHMAPCLEALRNVTNAYETELSIVIYALRQIPAIHFRTDQIKRLAELSAEIDVDVYYQPGVQEDVTTTRSD